MYIYIFFFSKYVHEKKTPPSNSNISNFVQDLSLDSCQISHVPTDTFTGLSYLRNLDLSDNLMIQLDSVALDALQYLKKLSIKG
jgi:Leucine-rich repeat (LRR) protein